MAGAFFTFGVVLLVTAMVFMIDDARGPLRPGA